MAAFVAQVYGGAVLQYPIWRNGGCTGSEVPQGIGRAILFISSDSVFVRRTATIGLHTLQTDDRQTDEISCRKREYMKCFELFFLC